MDGSPIETRIARNPAGRDFPIAPRAPYGRHILVGGNHVVPAMLRDHADELRPPAPRAAFDATLAEVHAQLSERTARIEVVVAGLELRVRVENLTGHKLPTGFPSRRVWLRVTAEDASGVTAFESGGYDARGRLVDGAGAILPSERRGGPVLPHVDRVEDPSIPAIWEAVMADPAGAPTFTLLRGAAFLRDDRLLPRGWRDDHPDARFTRPVGVDGDSSFGSGADEVTVSLPAGATRARVELLYQVISPRWVDELGAAATPEVIAFLRYWDAADVRPVVLARAEVSLAP